VCAGLILFCYLLNWLSIFSRFFCIPTTTSWESSLLPRR